MPLPSLPANCTNYTLCTPQANYVAPRMVVVAAGPVEHEQIVALVDKAFAATPTTPSGPSAVDLQPAYFTGSDIRVRDDEMALAHIATAWETVELTHADSPATMVIQAMLGSFDAQYPSAIHSSSNMISVLAGDNPRGFPLVQSAMTFNTQYTDTGLFGVYYTAEMDNVMEAQWAVMREFQRLCHNASDESVEMAKMQLKSTIVGQLDSSLSQVFGDAGRWARVLRACARFAGTSTTGRGCCVDESEQYFVWMCAGVRGHWPPDAQLWPSPLARRDVCAHRRSRRPDCAPRRDRALQRQVHRRVGQGQHLVAPRLQLAPSPHVVPPILSRAARTRGVDVWVCLASRRLQGCWVCGCESGVCWMHKGRREDGMTSGRDSDREGRVGRGIPPEVETPTVPEQGRRRVVKICTVK